METRLSTKQIEQETTRDAEADKMGKVVQQLETQIQEKEQALTALREELTRAKAMLACTKTNHTLNDKNSSQKKPEGDKA